MEPSFKFSRNAYGYDVVWRDSARYLGFVWRKADKWGAKTPDDIRLPDLFDSRIAAAWALFKVVD